MAAGGEAAPAPVPVPSATAVQPARRTDGRTHDPVKGNAVAGASHASAGKKSDHEHRRLLFVCTFMAAPPVSSGAGATPRALSTTGTEVEAEAEVKAEVEVEAEAEVKAEVEVEADVNVEVAVGAYGGGGREGGGGGEYGSRVDEVEEEEVYLEVGGGGEGGEEARGRGRCDRVNGSDCPPRRILRLRNATRGTGGGGGEGARGDAPLDSASLPLEHRAAYGPPPPPGLGGLGALGALGGGHDDPWPLATPDMPQIKHLQVQCEKTHMRVNIEFDRPFYGMIFSKGFYSDPHCVHLKPGTGHLSATFEIFLNSCGMSSSANHNAGAYGAPTPSGSYVENTIIIQYDPYVQEVWDQARKLRCTWYDFYEKAVTFRPFQVDMLNAVTANFLGDNLQCWMQIQVGKGPWASEVSGIVKIGQTMTMVLAIKDDENKFDMLVRNCVAHDGKRAPIQLVDQYGCVVRPKIMSKFQKIKNFGPSASVVSFAYFQAFKFPDSMNVHFQCVIQVCRYNCPEPKCGGGALGLEYGAPGLGLGHGLGGDYSGAAGNLHSEYGPPPPLGEYGAPAGYPGVDPRHPSGPAGAYSESKETVVRSDQQPQAASGGPSTSTGRPESSGAQAAALNGGNGGGASNSDNEVHLPPPPPPGFHGAYATVAAQKRKGQGPEDGSGGEGALAVMGARPRSVELDLQGARRRRHALPVLDALHQPVFVVATRIYKRAAQEMTDVVAPGDVNFALGGAAANETVVIQSATDPEHICMSVPSFVGGLVMLLLVLVVACLVAAFLFVRVRAVDRKGAAAFGPVHHAAFEGAEFVKVAN
ncbi:Uncharacterized protein GBIM_12867 [Gryllus bimaculatus]|nr:Uncharacterized protein GBIM_12867 [Gryllus bimaculatus]